MGQEQRGHPDRSHLLPPPGIPHLFFLLLPPPGTSNWSGDYFLHTAGSALVVAQSPARAGDQPTLREQLQRIFERDWNSGYSRDLDPEGQWEALCSAR